MNMKITRNSVLVIFILISFLSIFVFNWYLNQNPKTIYSDNYELREIEWSAQGNFLAFPYRDGIRIWDLSKEEVVISRSINLQTKPFRLSIDWNPKGDELVFSPDLGGLYILVGPNFEVTRSLNDSIILRSVKWSPDGLKIAARVFQTNPFRDIGVKIWDAKTLEEISTIDIKINDRNSLDWSDDSQFLVLATTQSKFIIWDVNNDKTVLNQSTSGKTSQVYWHPKGDLIAVVEDSSEILLWDVNNQKWLINRTIEFLYEIDWNPSESFIAVTNDQGIQIWDYKKDQIIWKIDFNQGSLPISWNPQHNLIAFSRYTNGQNDEIKLLNVDEWNFFFYQNQIIFNFALIAIGVIGIFILVYKRNKVAII